MYLRVIFALPVGFTGDFVLSNRLSDSLFFDTMTLPDFVVLFYAIR